MTQNAEKILNIKPKRRSRSLIYQRVKNMFVEAHSLGLVGLTLLEACARYRQLYPEDTRDIASMLCGQKSYGNFKIIGTDMNNHAIYALHIPTLKEKYETKIAAIHKSIAASHKTLAYHEMLLKKVCIREALGLKHKARITPDMISAFDQDPLNFK